MDSDAFTLRIHKTISSFTPGDWNRLAGPDNPFTQHDFLCALEDGGAVGGDSGWDSTHIGLSDASGKLVGVMPHYLKHHSYGEYIFDHSWANAYAQAGGAYYPKSLSAVPFTPATGPRLLTDIDDPAVKTTMARGLVSLVDRHQLSSAHINFLPADDARLLADAGWLIRSGTQFHWHNQNYEDFDGFLQNLSSRKRKNIRKERASIADAGVTMLALSGDDIKPHHIDHFYAFYLSTIDRKWGGAYLTRRFFDIVHATMAEKILLVMAIYDGDLIGGALNFIGTETLYGRNWGASRHIQNLHFEACYYQAIEFAITHKLRCVEAGAQGFHKVQRGYLPVTTYSAHWIAHDGFRQAVERFLRAEARGVADEQNQIALASPFRKNAAD
jgi:predicted N-acyltransferase